LADTKTTDDVRNEIASAFDGYMAELEQAGPHWDRKPSVGEGEDAWCARQVAEHIAGAGPYFGAGIAQAIGVQGPTPAPIQLPDPGAARIKTRENHGLLMDVVAQVKDEHLSMEVNHPRLGQQTLGGILGIVTYHLKDHASQLRALREG
jgi:hypothetical protein